MSTYPRNEQEKEIKTIRPRNISIALSDKDCERITNKASIYNMTVSELLAAFIGDLISGTYSRGSDERMLANEYFERCSFSWEIQNSFLNYLIECDTIDYFIELVEEIEYREEENKILKASGAKRKAITADIAANFSSINDIKNEITNIYNDYTTETENPQDKETAMQSIFFYRQELYTLKGEEPHRAAHRPANMNTADIETVCNTGKEYFTPKEAAQLLNLHYNTVRNMIKKGLLPASRICRQWRIAKQDLLNYNRNKTV